MTNPAMTPGRLTQTKGARIPRLFSISEAAEALGCSAKTVRRRIAAGDLCVHRVGRQLRISEADLADFIARCRCPLMESDE